jgi:redox-sensing transcriptional repressor
MIRERNRMVPNRTIGRISLYRRLLAGLLADGTKHVFSHELAALAGVSPAQVRRDIMSLGYSGSPAHGYAVEDLINSIGQFLDAPAPEAVALVGVGNLGRAILSYFAGRRPNLTIVAAFDSDPAKANRIIQGCPCHPTEQLASVIAEQGIRIGIIAVPAAAAQGLADLLVRAGVRGILNFAPVPLWVPGTIYVENMDMTMSLEKVAYFARQQTTEEAVR